MLQILHQIINQQHEESSFLLLFPQQNRSLNNEKKDTNIWWDDKNYSTDFQESCFSKLFSADNFQDKEIIWSQKYFEISKLIKI